MVALALTTGGLQLLLPSSSSHPSPTKDLQLLHFRDNISHAAPQCMSPHPSQPVPQANLPIANLPANTGALHEASLPFTGLTGLLRVQHPQQCCNRSPAHPVSVAVLHAVLSPPPLLCTVVSQSPRASYLGRAPHSIRGAPKGCSVSPIKGKAFLQPPFLIY